MLNRDYAEMLRCLTNHGVEHLVVGAYALAGHGLPLSTGDIDFEEAWKDRLDCILGGITLHVLGIEALVKNKLGAARPKDLEDVRSLRRRAGNRRIGG
jgi:hypothetical protein